MLVGFAGLTQPGEVQRFLNVPNVDVQVEYLNYSVDWTAPGGMISNVAINRCAGATKAIISVPMLVGPQSGSPLTGSGSGQTTSPQNPSGTTTPTTMTLAGVAAGTWDSLFTQAFQTIATVRPDCILRIGWEQYGNGWYPWNGVSLTSQYAAAYNHLAALALTVSSSFQFDWNGNVAFASYDPTVAYPLLTSAYVNFMTTDVYDSFSPGGAAGFAAYVSAVLSNALNYAIAQGKPFGIPEWGQYAIGFDSGYGDDPGWMLAVFEWLWQNAANIAYVCYFQNYTGSPSGNGSSALQRNPNAAAAFTALFGGWAQQNAGYAGHRYVSLNGTTRGRL